ncbi:MAG: HAMP domain-containing histidine kinase [Rhodomicrobium sp.]|nr:HAMP domain-containing histidine kinase [Rhodomicrobium sp.]
MSRLYIRIYLAVLGSLLVFALLAGLAAALMRSLDDDRAPPWADTGAEIVERLLPADRDDTGIAQELTFWQERTGFSLLLLSAQGEVIARAGDFPDKVLAEAKERAPSSDPPFWRGRRGLFGVTLKDGRQLIALRERRHRDWLWHLRFLPALLGIGLAVGIAAYPIVRHLTRRLESLEQGVVAFGGGDLSARAVIKGRDEVAKLAESFNASADRIEALLNAHKTLLANASHELRSPLSRLRMALEGLQGEDRASLAFIEINRNIAELDALVGEILLASRLQANAANALTLETVDLAGLLAEECAAFKAELNVLSAEPPSIEGDARLLRRLFRNLLENAARHGGSQPASVSLGMIDGMAQVTVCDRGPGVPEPERERIFEPFYRLKGTAESAGGAGLGLALVKQIAERHGGSVRCVPREGGGACFKLLLPMTQKTDFRSD